MPPGTQLASIRPSDLDGTSMHVSSLGISSLEDILIFEQPLLRVPVDELRTQLKTQQRLWERDFLYCSNILQSKMHSSEGKNTVSTSMELRPVIERLYHLRTKVWSSMLI